MTPAAAPGVLPVPGSSKPVGFAKAEAKSYAILTEQGVDRHTLHTELHRLAHERSSSGVAIMAEALQMHEKRFPSMLPELEILKQWDRNVSIADDWVKDLGAVGEILQFMVLSDVREGQEAADKFLRRFSDRYAQSESGKTLYAILAREVESARADLRAGLAAWRYELPVERGE